MHLRVSLSRRRAPHWTCRNGGLSAQRKLTGEQFILPAVIHHEHDQVRRGAAYLEPKTAAFNTDRSRRRPAPAAPGPTGQVPLSIFPAEYESRRLEPRHNHDAVSILEQLLWNSLVRRCHDLRKYSGGLIQPRQD